jgi:hypothetical protein
MLEDTPLTTTGDQLRQVIATKFAEIGAAIDASETAEKLPHVVALKDAEGGLAKLELDDDTLEATYDNGLAAADIRATIEARYTPQKAAANAAIAKIESEANVKRAKLQAVGEDVGASPADELMALVEVEGAVTIESVRGGLDLWIAAQIQQERDAIEAAQNLHSTNIGVFSQLNLRLSDMSNDEIYESLNVAP